MRVSKEILKIIEVIAQQLAPKWRFAYHTTEDIKQFIRIECIIAIREKYDERAPVYNFLRAHIHNRCFNNKRDNFARPEPPCVRCPLSAYIAKTDTCTAFDCKTECPHYYSWIRRNERKKNIADPVGSEAGDDIFGEPSDIGGIVAEAEIVTLVETKISRNTRHAWLKWRAGFKVARAELQPLLVEIVDILHKQGVSHENW